MGACNAPQTVTSTPWEKDEDKRLTRSLLREAHEEKRAQKLLLLGAGECGKSTILRQMQILHCGGFDDLDRKSRARLVHSNVLESMQMMLQACINYNVALDPAVQPSVDKVRGVRLGVDDAYEALQELPKLWLQPGVRQVFVRGAEYQLLDSCAYWMANLDRLIQKGYMPLDQDILRTRVPTCGVIETEFHVGDTRFRMVDVGGQRGERKKWIHSFEDVNAIMFVTSLAEYDMMLREDPTRNRMSESLSLFQAIVSLSWFESTPVILFLNKNDLFELKVKEVDMGLYFPKFTGGKSYEKALAFQRDEYFALNTNPNKVIYAHVTNAADTNHISLVWATTRDIILRENLQKAGLYAPRLA